MQEWIDTYDRRDWQTVTDSTVRCALIGLGWWTTDVALPAMASSELCEATVLVSGSSEKAERHAAEYGVDQGISYDEFHDGAASERYDAVYIATPNAFHLEYAETAAELEKAVLCEKPMEATVERARQLAESCEVASVPLMIAYRMHTDPAVRRAHELIEAGFLGDPVAVHGDNCQPLLEMNPDEGQWRLDSELTGYGASVMDLGIYSINTTRFLLRREPVVVQAQMSSHHEAFHDVPDERSGSLLTFEDDIKVVTTASQNAHDDTQLKLTGTDGQIEFRPAFHGTCSLHLSRNDLAVTAEHEQYDAQREMREEFDYFADRVLEDKEIFADGKHGLQDMRIIRAIHEAAKTDEAVKL